MRIGIGQICVGDDGETVVPCVASNPLSMLPLTGEVGMTTTDNSVSNAAITAAGTTPVSSTSSTALYVVLAVAVGVIVLGMARK